MVTDGGVFPCSFRRYTGQEDQWRFLKSSELTDGGRAEYRVMSGGVHFECLDFALQSED